MDRNLILALVLSMLIIFGYQALIVGPKQKAWKEAEAARQAAIEAQGPAAASSGNPDILAPSTAEVGREEALSTAPGRVLIKTDELEGSINLRGLVFDDLKLSEYKLTLDPDSPPMTLLSPRNSPHAQFMRSGLQINGQPDASVVWSAPQDAVLTLETPVTFTRTQGDIEHEVTISVDEHFMFTFTQTVRNGTDAPATVQGYAGAFQKGIPPDLKNMMMLYEGPVGVVQGDIIDRKYKNVLKKGPVLKSGVGGWIGLTDKYKLAAVIPPQDMPFRADIKSDNAAVTPTFQSTYLLDPQTVPAGGELTMTSHLFGGAKEVKQLREYENNLGIDRFDEAVDWGNILWLLTRGIFAVLSFFHGLVGNWGVAILLLTLVIKAILFPLANLSYKSMAGMKKVQPELKKVQERYKDDKAKQQQEMMALYKKYKINPAAGCLPILAQMPIFFALYKTLFVTTELRHEPFLYIKDLAERDPTSIFNLFGLLPYDPLSVPVIGSFLGLGILPLLMGAAMYVQTKLNPPPTDDTQKLIFGLMPLIFMFIFAPFAAGLVLYWFWNTFLSVLQQYVIMKRQGADVDILGNIKASFGKSPDAANENKAKQAKMSPRYALIGDGRLATSLGPYLQQSGAALTLWSRRAEASGGLPLSDAVREADTVLLAISDGAIKSFAAEHRATLEGKRLVHFSGAHSFEGMTGWHPLYSFPAHAVPFTQMSTILFVGEEMDEEGNTDFSEIFPMLSNSRTAITKEEKPLYHALAVLSGNLVSFTWNEVARVLEEELGLPSVPLLAPYFRSLIDGFTASPLDSLTGPVARGDQATIEKNLAALESQAALRPLYDALLTAAARKGIPS